MHQQPGLGSGVVPGSLVGLMSIDRRNVHYGAAGALRLHRADGGLGQPVRRVEVDIDHLGPEVVGQLGERCNVCDGGVVDQTVDAAVMIDRSGNDALRSVGSEQIRLDRSHGVAGGINQMVDWRRPRVRHHRCTGRSEALGDASADAATSAGHHDDAAVQSQQVRWRPKVVVISHSPSPFA